ncbi:hypothetical protein FS837_008982 [Tulasnella sp. UAMH 9824]|nr:hypothetical protein FS837_008982 [Tulasnella sp. UAMH 9824]
MDKASAFHPNGKLEPTEANWATNETERKPAVNDGITPKGPEFEPVVETMGGDELRPVQWDDPLPGPSGHPPEPPPDFSLYEAETKEDDDGNVFSHDHHLNTDGEALYRFLLQEGAKPPKVFASLSGSHTETHTRVVTRQDPNGHPYTTTEAYTETITDFQFEIDVTQHLLSEPRGPPVWIVGDREPARRGNRKRQVDNIPYMMGDETSSKELEAGMKAVSTSSNWRRKATDVEKESADKRAERRWTWGLPAWVLLPGEIRGTEANIEDPTVRDALQGSVNTKLGGIDDINLRPPVRTLREWADEYTRSQKMSKKFVFKKEVYGWNWGKLEEALDSVLSANYSQARGTTSVEFRFESEQVSVRVDTKLSKMLSNIWWCILLWILLIYPLIIWPFKRFSSYGGGEWRVAGSSFALTKWVHLTDSRPGQTPEQYQAEYNAKHFDLAKPRKLRSKQTPVGVSQLIGLREGEWFAQWKDTIGTLVRQRYISDGGPLKDPMNIRGGGRVMT